MILTLEQWEGIPTAVNQDEGGILKAIKEKLNEKMEIHVRSENLMQIICLMYH